VSDWDSIREAQGFRVGDQVRGRGPELGTIQHLIDARGTLRAHVHWPTIPFECEGMVSSGGSESFVDLDKLRPLESRAVRQLGLFEAHSTNSREQL
jgi:hypothetical protein